MRSVSSRTDRARCFSLAGRRISTLPRQIITLVVDMSRDKTRGSPPNLKNVGGVCPQTPCASLGQTADGTSSESTERQQRLAYLHSRPGANDARRRDSGCRIAHPASPINEFWKATRIFFQIGPLLCYSRPRATCAFALWKFNRNLKARPLASGSAGRSTRVAVSHQRKRCDECSRRFSTLFQRFLHRFHTVFPPFSTVFTVFHGEHRCRLKNCATKSLFKAFSAVRSAGDRSVTNARRKH